ncbi:MAG: response regulator transcription factor [Phycisphaerae bacterium]|nr:response regulator transcription factor [Phycisphaerae bacterium]
METPLVTPSRSPVRSDGDANQPVPATPRTRVLCVDDSADMSEMLALFIRRQPDMEDAGVLGSAEGIVDEVIRCRAAVVVLDLTMPGPSPLEAIRELRNQVPSCRVIAFSGYDDQDTRESAQRAGAWELVSKHGDLSDILKAIRRVVDQEARA